MTRRSDAPRSRPGPDVRRKDSPADGNWIARLDRARLAAIIAKSGTPAYVYSAEVLRARCRDLREAFPGAQMRYAMKANSNPAILALIRNEGIGVDTVSVFEVRLARESGFRKDEIIYSGSMPSDDELREVHRRGALLNLDALSALDRFGRIAPGARVSLRLNLDIGAGHHPHVITAGPSSKFGLSRDELPAARRIARKHRLRIVGLHQHIGSGLFDPDPFMEAIDRLFELAPAFREIELLDIGGGFGVPYRADESAVDLSAWGREVASRKRALEQRLGREIALVLEPGRYVVAEAGALLVRVTTVKPTADRVFVGVDSGMHHLVRPALYGSFHPLHVLSLRKGKPARCFIVGPICESGDVLAEERWIVPPREGDLLAIGVAGAYGYAMASQYNLRARPAEVLVDGARVREIRRRERYGDVVRGQTRLDG